MADTVDHIGSFRGPATVEEATGYEVGVMTWKLEAGLIASLFGGIGIGEYVEAHRSLDL
jgi:hypothetical protein